jgi:hypothetical protein
MIGLGHLILLFGYGGFRVYVPWWVWLLVALYCAPGVYCFVTLLTMKPIGRMREEDELPPPPRRRWLKMLMLPVAFVVVLVLWPTTLWADLRR